MELTVGQVIEALSEASPDTKLRVCPATFDVTKQRRNKVAVVGVAREYIGGGDGIVAMELLTNEEE